MSESLRHFCLGVSDLLSVADRLDADNHESLLLALRRIVSAIADDTEASP